MMLRPRSEDTQEKKDEGNPFEGKAAAPYRLLNVGIGRGSTRTCGGLVDNRS
jgi:hypothetical protein